LSSKDNKKIARLVDVTVCLYNWNLVFRKNLDDFDNSVCFSISKAGRFSFVSFNGVGAGV
jgi:hypothetical protein